MNSEAKTYLAHLKNLHYSEYAYQTRATQALVSGYRKNKKNNHLDFELLDLSLGQNEDVFQSLLSSIDDPFKKIGQYTFSQDENLIQLIAEREALHPDNILITSGCDGALRVISRMLIHPGTRVCIPLPSFPRYEYHAKVNRGNIHFIYPDEFPYHIDIDRVEAECKKKSAEVLLLANPNNPTGNILGKNSIQTFLDTYEGYFILDEALLLSNKQSCIDLLDKYTNLIIVRSFSKVYGLAGLRVGYILANKNFIELAGKLVSPFEISSISLSITEAALKNPSIIDSARKDIKEAISIFRELEHPHIKVSPTEAPTALLESTNRSNLYYELLKNGVKTVSCKSFRGLRKKNCVRISIKNKRLIRKLKNILAGI